MVYILADYFYTTFTPKLIINFVSSLLYISWTSFCFYNTNEYHYLNDVIHHVINLFTTPLIDILVTYFHYYDNNEMNILVPRSVDPCTTISLELILRSRHALLCCGLYQPTRPWQCMGPSSPRPILILQIFSSMTGRKCISVLFLSCLSEVWT